MKLLSTFLVTMTFFLLFYCSISFVKTEAPLWKKDIEMINRQIAELNGIKTSYESRICHHKKKYEERSFQQWETLTKKRHLRLIEDNKKIVENIEEDINNLLSKKQRIIQQNKLQKS
jgi:hypothetical protein